MDGVVKRLNAIYVFVILLFLGCVTAQDVTATYGKFDYIQQLDPIDDTDNSLIVVLDDSTSYRQTALIWRCTGSTLEVYVVPSDYLGSEDYYNITYRFGKNEAVSSRWGASTDGDAAFLPDAEVVAFSQQAAQTSTLAIRISDYEDTPHTYVFDLTGFTDAVAQLGCNPLD
jgi:hypothetical protein